MNKYALLFASIAKFLGGIVSGELTSPNDSTKEVLSRVGAERLVRAQSEGNANNRFASDLRPASDLSGFLVLLRGQDGVDEAMSVAGELLNRNILALERVRRTGCSIRFGRVF